MPDQKSDNRQQGSGQSMTEQQKYMSLQAEVRARISELQRNFDNLGQEVAHLKGQLLNLDPLLTTRLQRKNGELQERKTSLEKALFMLLTDLAKSRTQEEERIRGEMLRQAAVEHFTKLNIDPQLWKNLESW